MPYGKNLCGSYRLEWMAEIPKADREFQFVID